MKGILENAESLWSVYKKAGLKTNAVWWKKCKQILKVNIATNAVQGIIDNRGHIVTSQEEINKALSKPLKDLYTAGEAVAGQWGSENY